MWYFLSILSTRSYIKRRKNDERDQKQLQETYLNSGHNELTDSTVVLTSTESHLRFAVRNKSP